MRSWSEYKKTMNNDPSLGLAAKANDIELILKLLKDGKSINERDHRGYSPLMMAAYMGHSEAVEVLLRNGADPNSIDAGGNTVLMGACFKGNLTIIQTLIESGADINSQNLIGMTAADFAMTFGRTEVLELLKKHQLVPQKTSRLLNLLNIHLSKIRFSSSPTDPKEEDNSQK